MLQRKQHRSTATNAVNSINKCSLNLTQEQYATIGTTTAISYGNNSTADDYRDVKYSDCYDGGTVLCTRNENALVYDVYYPVRTRQELDDCGLPAVALFHGGSYTDCGTFRSPQTDDLCRNFARRGFVVFNVEYRRGVKIDTDPNPNPNPPENEIQQTSAQQVFAIYRGIQDVRGFLRTAIKKQTDSGAYLPYTINSNALFVGGGSAGGVIAMAAVYYNQAMLDTVFRTTAGGLTAIQSALGPVDANYYYAPSTVSFKQKIKAVFNLWGGLIIPFNRFSNASEFFRNHLSTFTQPFHRLLAFMENRTRLSILTGLVSITQIIQITPQKTLAPMAFLIQCHRMEG